MISLSMRRIAIALVSLAALTTLIGCSSGAAPKYKPRGPVHVNSKYQGSYPIRVVCTTGMVAELVRNVGGKHVQVQQIMKSDADPHLYKATPGDMIQLEEADLIFYSGLHLEGKMTEIFESMAHKKPTFAVAEYYSAEEVLLDEDETLDPHVWFDVRLWNKSRGLIEEVLTKFDPVHADDYRQQGDAYRKELDKLHDYARTEMQSIPEAQRVLITAHDAFRYFGKAYGIQVKGIQGISTEAEASVRDINELVDIVVEKKIKAVFIESTVNPKTSKALIEGCSARGHIVVIGGELYSDAMGTPGTPEGTYVGMVRHNVDTIVQALK